MTINVTPQEGVRPPRLTSVRRRRDGVLRVVLAAALACAALLAGPDVAVADEPVYPVMNTSEYPPDGIYFRNSPNWDDAIRVSGHGVYAGDRVRLKCWEKGTNVPRTDGGTNEIWYVADNVTRPTSPRGTNSGWLNAHFVNDGTGPGVTAPGVIRCGTTPTAPPPSAPPTSKCSFLPPAPASAVYYSPFEGFDYVPSSWPAVSDVCKSQWANPNVSCDTSRANSYIPSSARTLAGWSVGRLGPIYALGRASAAQKQQITHVFMIDPGTVGDLSGCDSKPVQVGDPLRFKRPGQILAEWLRDNPNARLTVMAGNLTAQQGHASIQNAYFNDIRAMGSNVRNRVSVCNYDNTKHDVMFNSFNSYITRPPITGSCPTSGGVSPTRATVWHP